MDSTDRDAGEAATLVAASPDTLPTGQHRIELPAVFKYEIRDVIGRGGMGEVVLAHDPSMNRDVALKRMRADDPTDEAIARFLREAKIQARLDHPAIVPVHELGVDSEGRPFFTMKRLAGTTLAQVMESGAATLQRLLRAVVDVCHAIELAHARQVVHRDLKPSNIMLGDYGEVYVLDWGVARVLEDGPELPQSGDKIPSLGGQTQTGELLGTPGYMAPEQVRGVDVGPPVDVYALGSILFEILSGTPLHPRGAAALASTLGVVERSPATRAPDREVPPELDSVCSDALAADPSARPTARALGDRIQAFLDGDRDLVARRQHAAKLVTSGRAALLGGQRAEAVHLGGRALALDPSSDEAAELVMSLVLRPPDELPGELATDLRAVEKAARQVRSRRALFPYLVPFALLPLLGYANVTDWPMLAAVYASILMMAVVAFVNSRTGAVPVVGYLAAHFMMVTMFSRISGPFVLTPMMIVAVALSLTALPSMNERPLLTALYVALLVIAPFALEWAGVFAPGWSLSPDGVVSKGSIFADRDSIVPLFAGNLAIAVLIAHYARGISRDRQLADRRLLIQRWHLLQLLPRAAAVRARAWVTSRG